MKTITVEATATDEGRYVAKPVSNDEFAAAASAQRDWQLGLITADEEELRAAGVPECFWLYVACNSQPNIAEAATGLGTWWDKREHATALIEDDIAEGHVYADPTHHAKFFAVVDGRDAGNVRRIIFETWDEEDAYDMEEAWKRWVTRALKQM